MATSPAENDMTAAAPSMKVVWSVCHTGGWDEDYIATAIDHAARQGASGIELMRGSIDPFVTYSGFPALAPAVDHAARQTLGAMLDRICKRASDAGLTVGIWHHEVAGVGRDTDDTLLRLLPELRAADGLINLESPLLYQLITARIGEFLDRFPLIGEIVLTLTETRYPVMHRPFSTTPPAERIRRVLQAAADATEPRNRTLVIRPFSALREDERNTELAIDQLTARRIAVMYKTEPADWHPFLPDEQAFSRPWRFEVRAESDGGAEYYGQTDFPCSYTRHIARRFAAARDRGATVAILRIDRGHARSALGKPINEANAIAVHRWLRDPAQSLSHHYQAWLKQRYNTGSAELEDLLESTFDVIKHALYLDGHALSHRHFPSYAHAHHIQIFSLFEPGVSLEHLAENWAALASKQSPSHTEILREKDRALELAMNLPARFDRVAGALPEEARSELRQGLGRLELLAAAARAYCRLIIAHLGEVWRLESGALSGFDAEARAVLAIADRVESSLGRSFFGLMSDTTGKSAMPEHLRTLVRGLEAERRYELPRRAIFDADATVLDYVLCGIASEGHRLRKRLHVGASVRMSDGLARRTGLGPAEGFGYTLRLGSGREAILRISGPTQDAGASGRVRAGDVETEFKRTLSGEITAELRVRGSASGQLPISVWSTAPAPLSIRQIVLQAPAD